jgi:Holliday junction DNA helicase RuvA
MIGQIKGKLASVDNNQGLIETASGLSFLVYLTPSLISQSAINQPISVLTYLQVKEDALVLFGFSSKEEEVFFKLLLTVSGVGPKTAYNVIASTKVGEIIQAIKDNDINYFTQVPGLGKKTAMKIILELSQKLKQDFQIEKMYLTPDDKTVIDALTSLGYPLAEARSVFQKIPKELTIPEKIKYGLQIKDKK